MITLEEIMGLVLSLEHKLDEAGDQAEEAMTLANNNRDTDIHHYSGAFRGSVENDGGRPQLWINEGYIYAGDGGVYHFPTFKCSIAGFEGPGKKLVCVHMKVDPDTGLFTAGEPGVFQYTPSIYVCSVDDFATVQAADTARCIIGIVTLVAASPDNKITEWQQRHMGDIYVPVWIKTYHNNPLTPPVYKCSWEIGED